MSRCHVLVVGTLFLTAAAQVAIEQKCYYGAGKPADAGDAIATNCSTLAYGRHASCCFPGYVCLEQNACFDHISGNTYQYGCTDPTYQASSCPKKCDFDSSKSPWIALLRNGCAPNEWACHHPDNCGKTCPNNVEIPWPVPPFALPPANCTDLDPQRIAFTATNEMLTALVTLDGPGGTPSTPVAVPTPSTSAQGSTQQSPSQQMSSQPPISSAPSPSTASYSATAEHSSSPSTASPTYIIGIQTSSAENVSRTFNRTTLGVGIGVGLGGFLLVAALTGFICFRRRQKKGAVQPPIGTPGANNEKSDAQITDEMRYSGPPAYKAGHFSSGSVELGAPEPSELAANPAAGGAYKYGVFPYGVQRGERPSGRHSEMSPEQQAASGWTKHHSGAGAAEVHQSSTPMQGTPQPGHVPFYPPPLSADERGE